MEKRELHSVLTDFLNERLIQVTASGQAEKNDFLKAKIRPVLAKGALHFQAEEFIGKQAFHKISPRRKRWIIWKVLWRQASGSFSWRCRIRAERFL